MPLFFAYFSSQKVFRAASMISKTRPASSIEVRPDKSITHCGANASLPYRAPRAAPTIAPIVSLSFVSFTVRTMRSRNFCCHFAHSGLSCLQPDRCRRVLPEQAAIPNVPADHLYAPMPRLSHDRPFADSSHRRRSCQPGPQAVTGI